VYIDGAGHNTISEFDGYYGAVNRFLIEDPRQRTGNGAGL